MKKLFIIALTLTLLLVSVNGCSKKKPEEKQENKTVASAPKDSGTEKIDGTEKPTSDEKTPDEKADTASNVTFSNANLEKSLKTALGKETLTLDDIQSVKYLAIGPDNQTEYSLYVGLSDYADAYFAELQKPEASAENLTKYVKSAKITCDDKDTYEDLGKFSSIEIFEYYNIPIKDVSFIKSYTNLYYGYFNANGITDVSSLSDFAPKTLQELDFTGNSIADWKPLEHIKDKVIVLYTTENVTNDDGSTSVVPKNIMLKDLLDGEKITSDSSDKSAEEKAKEQSQDIDWSVLFGDDAEKK